MIVSVWLLFSSHSAIPLEARGSVLRWDRDLQHIAVSGKASSQNSPHRANPSLWWVMGLPLLAGVGVALALHGIEQRADRDTQNLERLQEDALCQLSVLVAESQRVLHHARACLHQPPTLVCLDQLPLSLPAAASAMELSKIREDCQQGDRWVIDGRYAEAIAMYQRALLVRRDAYQVWNNQGNAFFYLEQYERALAAYDKALQLHPQYAEAWNNRGSTLAQWRRWSEALTCYDKALQYKPTYGEAWYNRGLILYELGQYTESLLSYDRAVPQRRNYPDFWRHRGHVLVILKQYSSAIAAYDTGLNLAPEDPDLYYRKAGCYAVQGNIDVAWETLQRAIDIYPGYQEHAKIDPEFSLLRGDPRFQQMVDC